MLLSRHARVLAHHSAICDGVSPSAPTGQIDPEGTAHGKDLPQNSQGFQATRVKRIEAIQRCCRPSFTVLPRSFRAQQHRNRLRGCNRQQQQIPCDTGHSGDRPHLMALGKFCVCQKKSPISVGAMTAVGRWMLGSFIELESLHPITRRCLVRGVWPPRAKELYQGKMERTAECVRCRLSFPSLAIMSGRALDSIAPLFAATIIAFSVVSTIRIERYTVCTCGKYSKYCG